MTLYALQRMMFDRVRGRDPAPAARASLAAEELAALDAADVAALFTMGVHPVLLNSFCRLVGLRRDDYRALLAGAATETEPVEVPWRSS